MYHPGQRIYYRRGAHKHRAVVSKVHHEESQPYYTLRLVRSGREVQTESKFIVARTEDHISIT